MVNLSLKSKKGEGSGTGGGKGKTEILNLIKSMKYIHLTYVINAKTLTG